MEKLSKLAQNWMYKITESQLAHFGSSATYTRWHIMLGAVAVVTASITGVSGVANIKELNAALPYIALLAALSAGLQTFLRFPEFTERHQGIARDLSSVKRDLEVLIATAKSEEELKHGMELIKISWNSILKSAPTPLACPYEKARKEVEKKRSIKEKAINDSEK